MELNFNFSNNYEFKSQFLVLLSIGKTKHNRDIHIPVREVFFLDTNDPLVEFSNSVKPENIKILQIPEHQSAHFKIGMIFNSNGSFNEEFTKQRQNNLVFKSITVDPKRHYKGKGINRLLAKTLIPKFIIDYNRRSNFDSSCYLIKEPITDIKVIIPNSLILRYFYYLDESLALLMLNRKFNNIVSKSIRTSNYNLVIRHDNSIENSLIQQYAKYLFIEGKESTPGEIKIAINSYYRDLFNANSDAKKEPHDIKAHIPFDIELNFSLKGEMIAENKFLAYDIVFVTPSSPGNPLFSPKPMYIIDTNLSNNPEFTMDSSGDNSSNKMYLERKGFANHNSIETNLNPNHFLDSPKSYSLNSSSIEYLRFQDKLNLNDEHTYADKLNHKDRKLIITNSDTQHFNLTQKAINESGLNFKYLTINNSYEEPYSVIKLDQEIKTRIDVLNKILIVKILHQEFEFIVIDTGAEFPIWVLYNTGTSIRTKNNKRLTKLINFLANEFRFNWQLFHQTIKNQLDVGINLKEFQFVAMEPLAINPELADEEIIQQLQTSLKYNISKAYHMVYY